jgi:alanine racemase
MTRPVLASIDTAALQHNLSRVRQLSPAAKVMAIVKADAYGHQLLPVCRALSGTDAFGLLDLADAISLRNAGFTQPICLLEGFFTTEEISLIAANNLETVIHSSWQLDELQLIKEELNLSVWLKVDTGMNRLGFPVLQFSDAVNRLSAMSCVGRVSIMSHLASADVRDSMTTGKQLKDFLNITDPCSLDRSLANSAAILAHTDCHFDWVRPGIMLYGSSPFAESSAADLDLKPVMTLESEIISIKECKKGDAVGYAGAWTCPEDMPVAVIACGYGDGYPRHAPTGTPVMVAGQKTQLIGRVSMDMITVDLRGINNAEVGSAVELWGSEISIDEVAKRSETIAYELLCGITARVSRKVVANG